MPGKTASRALRPIEETIPARIELNVEFQWWIDSQSRPGLIDTFDLMLEKKIRPVILNMKLPSATHKIKKYVGEFY